MTAVLACEEKAMLFMEHRMRVVNQQIVIQKVLDQLKINCINDWPKECVITID